MIDPNCFDDYETWCVCNWLFTDAASRKLWRDASRWRLQMDAKDQRVDRYTWPLARVAKSNLAHQMSTVMADQNPLQSTDAYWDLLNAALCRIDWQRIAEFFLDDVAGELFAVDKTTESVAVNSRC